MRFRLPDDCHGVTLGGVTLEATADGTVEADPALTADLATHGILPVEEPRPDVSKRPSRPRAGDR